MIDPAGRESSARQAAPVVWVYYYYLVPGIYWPLVGRIAHFRYCAVPETRSETSEVGRARNADRPSPTQLTAYIQGVVSAYAASRTRAAVLKGFE